MAIKYVKIPESELRALAFFIADARRLLEWGNISAAEDILDQAAGCIPDTYWPTEKELLEES